MKSLVVLFIELIFSNRCIRVFNPIMLIFQIDVLMNRFCHLNF